MMSIMASSSSRSRELSCCSECQASVPIYQCPGCLTRTCSLQCCQAHKSRTGCSGKRDRGSFVPKNQMTDSTLRSDYFFLEEVLQQIPRDGNSKRARTQHSSAPAPTTSQPAAYCKKSRRLLEQAKRRGVTLQIMPPMMVRHKSNSTWYCGPRDVMTWKVELIVYPSKLTLSFQLSETSENIMDHVISHCEKEGIRISHDRYLLYIMRLPCVSKQPRYMEVDPTACLKTILRGATIVEHPTIHCVPQEIKDQFPTGSDKIVSMEEGNETSEDADLSNPSDANATDQVGSAIHQDVTLLT